MRTVMDVGITALLLGSLFVGLLIAIRLAFPGAVASVEQDLPGYVRDAFVAFLALLAGHRSGEAAERRRNRGEDTEPEDEAPRG